MEDMGGVVWFLEGDKVGARVGLVVGAAVQDPSTGNSLKSMNSPKV